MKHNIRNINKRIARIKDLGITPITLKAPANIIEKIVYSKGTGLEGLIMSYKQAAFTANSERNEQLTLEEYNRSLNVFMNSYVNQTYVEGAVMQSFTEGRNILEYVYEGDDEFLEKIDTMNKKDIIKAVEYAGTKVSELRSKMGKYNFDSNSAFREYFEQWFEDLE